MSKLYESHIQSVTVYINLYHLKATSWAEAIRTLASDLPASGQLFRKLPHQGSSDLTPHLAFSRQAIIFSRESKHRSEVKRYYTKRNLSVGTKDYMSTFQNVGIFDRMGQPHIYDTGRNNTATPR